MRPPVQGFGPQQPRGAADPSATRPAFTNNSGSEPNSPAGQRAGPDRLAVIEDYAAATLGAFVAAAIAAGGTVVSDGWSGYARLKDVKHDPKVVGETPAHLVLPWIHRVFANAKRWALGVYHGL